MRAVRIRIEYAIDRARRRQAGWPPIDLGEFERMQRSRPWWKRAAYAMDVYARRQYRLAVGDILGSRRLRGYLRLFWAACCSPKLTRQRVVGEVRHHWRTWRPGFGSRSPVE